MLEPAYASASVRNSQPILGVLREELGQSHRLLEIGSGSAYHAVTFAEELPHLTWQTSDLGENHAYIDAAIKQSGSSNVRRPLLLDVQHGDVPAARYDAVYSCNTAHIMSFDAVQGMVALSGRALADGGLFILYGPFKRGGEFNTASNAAFDSSLRARDPEMGIRDLEAIDELAIKASLVRCRIYAMPANNLIVVWQKRERQS